MQAAFDVKAVNDLVQSESAFLDRIVQKTPAAS